MKSLNIDDIFTAIGQDSDSPELQRIFSSLCIDEKDLEKYPMSLEGRRLWSNQNAGLQLEFKDIGLIRDIPYHDIDEGPWVLTKFIFWGRRKKGNPYDGPLPYNLDFSMSRQDVREKMDNYGLGKATVLGFSEDVDMWIDRSVEIALAYLEEGGIHSISMGMPVDRSK